MHILDDAVAAIRKSPNIYIGDDPIGARFVERVVSDLILLDAAPLSVARSGAWYLITAARDWLQSKSGEVSLEPFYRLIPMPAGGLFYTRSEVVLTALADAVVTVGKNGLVWITGESTIFELPTDFDFSPALQRGRILAFHYTKFSVSGNS